jgi:hypothetical protein
VRQQAGMAYRLPRPEESTTMASVTLEMIFELQRRTLDELRDVRAVLREHTQRLGRIETAVAHAHVAQAEASVRMDTLAERIDRIERRLDISDT